ncbi:MAG: nicotinate-nucleotide adenylyltransferase [Gemmatimonadaceae bacterium]
MSGRLGILGGTFDPPHIGHLLLAFDALDQLALARVVLIPAARQPLKADATMTPAGHRLAMTRLLAAADRRLEVDPVEVEREGLSFTIDTVRGYRAAHPDADLYLLMGEDTAATLPQWREAGALAGLVRIAVAGRGAESRALPSGFRAERLTPRRVDLSATEIRERARSGRSIRGLVPDAVADYITTHRLYRPTD